MATEPLLRALSRMRGHLLDPESLVRAVASGARAGGRVPEVAGRPVRRVELRYVDLKAGRHLQVTSYDDTQAHTTNVAAGEAAKVAVDDLLDQPFGNWHVDTTTQTHQVRVTKKLEAVAHTRTAPPPVEADRGHDKAKQRLLPEDDPVLRALGHLRRPGPDQAQPAGEVPPGRGVPPPLDAGVTDALAGAPAHPDRGRPAARRRPRLRQRLPDLRRPPLPDRGARPAGPRHRGRRQAAVAPTTTPPSSPRRHRRRLRRRHDPRRGAAAAARRGARPARLRHRDRRRARPGGRVGVAARAGRALLPPRHRRAAAQAPTPSPYALLTRHGILRERFADTLTDAVRAALLRMRRLPRGRRAVRREQAHARATPCCARRGREAVAVGALGDEYDDLVEQWGVRPRLADLLGLSRD